MQLTVYRRDNRKRNGRRWRQWIMVVGIVATLIGSEHCTLRVAQPTDGRRRCRRASLSWRALISPSGKFKCVGERNSAVTRSLPWRD